MLIPVTHSTQYVAECAKCRFSGQANTTLVQPRISVFHRPNPIWPSELDYTRARIRAGFLCTEIVWHTSQSPHTITRDRIAILIAAWGLAVQRWVWTNEKPYFPSQRFVPYSRTDAGNGGIRTQPDFSSEKSAAIARAVKVLVMDVWL